MTELIISVISLLILFPIIYFLPLGLTRKGKGFITVVAFFIANIGLFAKNTFSLWQIGLIILLLVFVTVYLIDKRFAKLLYLNSSTYKTASILPYQEDLKGQINEFEENLFEKEDTRFQLERDLIELEPQKESFDLEELSLDLNKIEKEEGELAKEAEELMVEDLELEELSFEKEETEESLLQEVVTDSREDDNIDIDDEIEFLMERKEIIENKLPSTSTIEEDEIEDAAYMSEIEQLLESEEFGENLPNMEQEDMESSTVSEQFEGENVEKLLIDMLDNPELDLMDLETFEEEIEKLPDTVAMNDKDSSSDNLNQESEYDKLYDGSDLDLMEMETFKETYEELHEMEIESTNNRNIQLYKKESDDEWMLEEDLDFEEVPMKTDSTISELVPQQAYSDSEVAATVSENEQDEILPSEKDFNYMDFLEDVELEDFVDDEDDDTLHQPGDNEQKTALQQQLFHTMVSQLHLAKKHLSTGEYEALVKEHLHPELPLQDYYTFASLLIEHYISQKEIGKLEGLLTNLEGKFTDFPILDMEIQYLSQQYCKKAR